MCAYLVNMINLTWLEEMNMRQQGQIKEGIKTVHFGLSIKTFLEQGDNKCTGRFRSALLGLAQFPCFRLH